MNKTVWIINHYASETYFDKGGRHYALAKYLRRRGYEPVVFCSNAVHGSPELYYQTDKLWHEHIAEDIDCPYVFVKSRTYAGNGRQRILNMIDFYRNVKKAGKEYVKKHGVPHVIYASSVHPLTLVAGMELAKYFGIKCVCEVRDLWPESFVAYGIIGKRNPLLRFMYAYERKMYTKADAVIFTMEGGRDYIIEKGWDTEHGGPIDLSKIHHINNGVDLEEFDYNKEHYVLDDLDLNDPEKLKIVYTGSLREINDIEGLLLAESILAGKNAPNHKVLIYGDGDKRKEWEKLVEERSIPNIVFKGRVGKKQIPYILSKADILFIDGAGDSPIVRFGMSQNKMFEYLAANKPIISPLNDNYNIVEKFGCGYKVDNCPEKIAEALELLLRSEELRADTGEAAKKAAKEYDFSALTEKLISLIEEEK